MPLSTEPIEALKAIRGVSVPADVGFRQIIVTGPPDSGKSSLVAMLGGWPEEGYLDLATERWWMDRGLTFRPREVHLGIPFAGHEESHAVFDKPWVDSPAEVASHRIQVPPAKRYFFNVNWRRKYVFDFQFPSAAQIYKVSKARARMGTHLLDTVPTTKLVERQLAAYETVALHFHLCGLRVFVRNDFQGEPRRIVDGSPG